MELVIDRDIEKVIRFMEETIPAVKLLWVAEYLPVLGRAIWDYHCDCIPRTHAFVGERTATSPGSPAPRVASTHPQGHTASVQGRAQHSSE